MMLAADYAAAVGYLDRSRLPAYVSFVEHASARGLANDADVQPRRYIRTKDGAVVSFPGGAEQTNDSRSDGNNPFRSDWVFTPSCYTPASEEAWRWNGLATVRIDLRATCANDDGLVVQHIYVDPQTFVPIAIDGTAQASESNAMTLALEVRYATVDRYVVPSELHVHVVGHGWLFWARERADVRYADYQFFGDEATVRRQATGGAAPRTAVSGICRERCVPTRRSRS